MQMRWNSWAEYPRESPNESPNGNQSPTGDMQISVVIFFGGGKP